MKKAVGIVAEYNPFHNGHKYQLGEAKKISKADICIAVISGNFVQRGEPAIFDKYVRTEMALNEGIDLVVEMPCIFAMNNSEYFAKAGVEILENLGCEYIAFGSEIGDLEALRKKAEGLNCIGKEEEEKIKALVKEGYSYPRALSIISEASLEPNDILAVSYLKNMKTAKPIVIKRRGKGHIETATEIRNRILYDKSIKEFVPDEIKKICKKNNENIASSEMFFELIMQKILTSSEDELNRAFGAEEGLGSKLKKNARRYNCFEDIVNDLKSKRYTRTRINRVIFNILLGISKDEVVNAKNYIRVLGFSDEGANYLKEIKKNEVCKLPIITNINKEDVSEIEHTLKKDILATDLYNLATQKDLYINSENVKKPLKF